MKLCHPCLMPPPLCITMYLSIMRLQSAFVSHSQHLQLLKLALPTSPKSRHAWQFVLFWGGHQPKTNRCGFTKGPNSLAQVRRILRNNLHSTYSYYLKDSDWYFTLGWLTSHYSGFPTPFQLPERISLINYFLTNSHLRLDFWKPPLKT